MTILSPITHVLYTSDGVTVDFDTTFYFRLATDLKVFAIGLDNSVEELTSGYTVSGADDPAGGTVTLAAPRAAGVKILIERHTPKTQPVTYVSQDKFPAKTHEAALDRLTMIAQEEQRDIERILGEIAPVLPIQYAGLIVRWRGEWLPNLDYTYGDTVKVAAQEESIYVCVTPHTSGALFSAVNWSLMLDQQGIAEAIAAAEAAAAAAESAEATAAAAATAATTASTAANNAATAANNAQTAATEAADDAQDATAQAQAAQATATAAAATATAAANKIPNPAGPADSGKVVQVNPAGDAYIIGPISGVSVTSVFGRGGTVVAEENDYSADQIEFAPYSVLTGINVEAALQQTADALVANAASIAANTAAIGGKQNLDAMLTALAGLVTVADRGLYFTGADAPALFTLSAFARTLLDDADQAAMRGTLGLGTAAVLNVGTAQNNVVQLGVGGALPAVSGANLTNLPASGAKLTAIRVYTANATWNKPGNLVFAIIEGVGGGGGSGGVPVTIAGPTAAIGGAGGAGGRFQKLMQAAALGATVAVTIGAGGTAGAAGANPGGTGGTTSFGAHASATGGLGGQAGSLTTSGSISENGALGGSASGGDLNITGQQGGQGLKSGSSTAGTLAGDGGHSPYGPGGRAEGPNNAGISPPAGSYGAGAAGAACRGNAGNGPFAGAAGAPGLVLVYEYTT